MAKVRISNRTVAALKGAETDQFLWDTDLAGFGLKATPAGRKVYVVQYRLGGGRTRTRRITIGSHGSPWTPDGARKEAKRILGKVANGEDPADERIALRKDLSIAELCDLYLTEGVTHKKATTIAMDRCRIERHVKPLLGRRQISEITRRDIEKFQQQIVSGETRASSKTKPRGRSVVRGGAGAATRTIGMLGAIFAFAVERGLRPDNPVRGVRRAPDRKRERFLSSVELTRLGQALSRAEKESVNPLAIAAIRLLVLTGCRRNEVLTLQWDDVNIEGGRLRLQDSKTGARVVRLAEPARQVLIQLPRIAGNSYVFPSTTGDGHLVNLQKTWNRVRHDAELDDVRLHDLRHTFASVAAGSGESLLIIGSLLGNKTASATQRYAHLSDDPVQDAAERTSGMIGSLLLLEGGQ